MLLRADEEGRQREMEKHGGGWSERAVQEEIIRVVEEWWRRRENQMLPLFFPLVDPDGKRVKQTQGSAPLAGGTSRLCLQLRFFNRPSRRQLGLAQRRPAWHHRQGCWKAAKHGVLKKANTEGDKMKTRGRPEEKESSNPKRSALMVQNCFVSPGQAEFYKRAELEELLSDDHAVIKDWDG